MSLPVLYSFRRCPYAMRARLAIAASGVSVELREIVLRDKAPEMLTASPKGTVPVLVTEEGRVVEESLDIMFWALRQHDPQGWLALDNAAMKIAKSLITRAETEFKDNLDRYKYASRYEGADPLQSRADAALFLKDLDLLLQGQRFLLGDASTIAAFAILPFIRQFANVDRIWYDAQDWPNLLRWLEEFLASPAFVRIMQKYPKWQAGDPVTTFPPQV